MSANWPASPPWILQCGLWMAVVGGGGLWRGCGRSQLSNVWFSLFLLSDILILNCHCLQESRHAAFVGTGIAAKSDA